MNRSQNEEVQISLLALLAALLIAANEIVQGGILGLVGTYAYWLVRILIESALFVGVLYAIERYCPVQRKPLLTYAGAMAISLVPFALAVTSLDLIVGLPELGLEEGENTDVSRLQAFTQELLYLLDNHVILCFLLLIPRLPASGEKKDIAASQPGDRESANTPARLFHETIEPPLAGYIYRIEAQEHYIRITTSQDKRMVLYRFSDAVREMPEASGMQVHRSHWVAFNAIREISKDGQKMYLHLFDEDVVPVSRSYQALVEERFGALLENPTMR